MVILHKGSVVADETPENLKNVGKASGQIVEVEVIGKQIAAVLKQIPGVTKVTKQKKDFKTFF